MARKRDTKLFVMDCRREVAYTSAVVGDLYRDTPLGQTVSRVTFPTKLAYAAQLYGDAKAAGTIDYQYYRDADAGLFGVDPAALDCPDLRYRTSFNATQRLIEKLDSIKDDFQEALLGGGKVNRNFAVAMAMRIAIDQSRGAVRYVKPEMDPDEIMADLYPNHTDEEIAEELESVD